MFDYNSGSDRVLLIYPATKWHVLKTSEDNYKREGIHASPLLRRKGAENVLERKNLLLT